MRVVIRAAAGDNEVRMSVPTVLGRRVAPGTVQVAIVNRGLEQASVILSHDGAKRFGSKLARGGVVHAAHADIAVAVDASTRLIFISGTDSHWTSARLEAVAWRLLQWALPRPGSGVLAA